MLTKNINMVKFQNLGSVCLIPGNESTAVLPSRVYRVKSGRLQLLSYGKEIGLVGATADMEV